MHLIAYRQSVPLRPPAALFPGTKAAVSRIFSCCILLLAAILLQSSIPAFAQEKITLSVKNTPLGSVFKSIESQCGYHFWFEDTVIAHGNPVTLEVKEQPLQQVLPLLFKDQPFSFKIVHKTIVVKRRPAGEKSPPTSEVQTIPVQGVVRNEKNESIPSATVAVKGSSKMALTNDKGEFALAEVDPSAILIISSVGYEGLEVPIAGRRLLEVHMKIGAARLGQATVIFSTGYQQVDQRKATGAYVLVDNQLFNRQIGPNVIQKLDGVTSGVLFTGTGSSLGPGYGVSNVAPNPQNKLGMVIRGQSTLSTLVNKDPLIILDEAVYEGDINNLDPEIIESVTVLKDASAAAVYGAKAGNGVVVLTTKKGKIGQGMHLSFHTNTTVSEQQNFDKALGYVDADDYIKAEDTLFSKGFFNSTLSSTNRYAVSPVIDLRVAQQAGLISAADANSQIDAFRRLDVRKDVKKYIYQRQINQQYGLTLSGGAARSAYALSLAFDKLQTALQRNGYNRFAVSSTNTFMPVKNLEITAGINYFQMDLKGNNPFLWGTGGLSTGGVYSSALLPYTQLAGPAGNHLAITKDLRAAFKDSVQRLGFQSWQYNPLDELAMADNTTRQYDILLKGAVKYHILPTLDIQLFYQKEYQSGLNREYDNPASYMMRNLVNKYTQYNATTKTFTYPFPPGGELALRSSILNVDNLRAQVNYSAKIRQRHEISAMAGAELRQSKTTTFNRLSFGYDDGFGTAVSNLNYGTIYPTNPSSSAQLPLPDNSIGIITNRIISYYTSLVYTYANLYTVSVTGRRDGANIFGVNINDKFTPLWSAGFRWNTSGEKFYRLPWLPYLNTHFSYGYNGNVYNASAYLTAFYSTSPITGAQNGTISSPPNPDLRWERVRNINAGIDFGLKGDRITGTMDWYEKDGLDLIEAAPLSPSTGFTSFNGNAASTRTRGVDLTLTSTNIKSGRFVWQTTLLLSTLKDKVTSYDVKQTALSIQSSSVALIGKPLFGVYSYRWAGLDPQTGDPQGYLGKEVSKNYQGIVNNFSPDSLVFNGSARPTVYGALRNTLTYGCFSLSFNIAFKLGYVFRNPTTSTNYSEVITNPNQDFARRWQQPGDEKFTYVPSMAYPVNSYRNQFYQYAEVLVHKADNVRLQDVRISYDLGSTLFKRTSKTLEVYLYGYNLGMLWKANNEGVDPDYLNGLPQPRSLSIGGKLNF